MGLGRDDDGHDSEFGRNRSNANNDDDGDGGDPSMDTPTPTNRKRGRPKKTQENRSQFESAGIWKLVHDLRRHCSSVISDYRFVLKEARPQWNLKFARNAQRGC